MENVNLNKLEEINGGGRGWDIAEGLFEAAGGVGRIVSTGPATIIPGGLMVADSVVKVFDI